MRFSFSEDQVAFGAQLRAFTERECSPSQLRAEWASDPGWSPSRWAALAQLGVAGLTVPESFGGIGLGMVDLALVLEESGRACLGEPIIETTALGVPLLSGVRTERTEELCASWLPKVAAGEAVLAVGTASVHGVPAAPGADLLLLELEGSRPPQLHALARDAVRLEPLRALDGGRRLALVDWEASDQSLLCSGDDAATALRSVHERAAFAGAAQLLGVAQQMISMAASYALERRQFGKPIGSFQAVKHMLADAAVRVEFARPLVYRAAWSLDRSEPGAGVNCSMAKAQAAEAALGAARAALQVHGAIGYTWEHDLHLWMKRAWDLASQWGGPAEHRARVLEALVRADR